ncbi:MAG TPA: hypothetical protein VN924_24870 [Bryobacteraceae bacterium]|nr:hypothetical protein [Bryobacteraceae bacterium]
MAHTESVQPPRYASEIMVSLGSERDVPPKSTSSLLLPTREQVAGSMFESLQRLQMIELVGAIRR